MTFDELVESAVCVPVLHTCGHQRWYWVCLADQSEDEFRDWAELRPCREQCPDRPRVREWLERCGLDE